jgi:hypothetical protein
VWVNGSGFPAVAPRVPVEETLMNDRILVTVAPGALGRIDRVAQDLRAAGVTVDQVLSASGIITGSVEASLMPAIGRVRGVASVESDTDVQLPPDGTE